MKSNLLLVATSLAAACGGSSPGQPTPTAVEFPPSVMVVDGPTGDTLSTNQLVQRLGGAEFVLLGEVHDNPIHHDLRARLLIALGARRPAVVFEQFAESMSPIGPLVRGESLEDWLDHAGFDRHGWRWPLHQPVVDAARSRARSIWGSNIPREALRPVVREGEAAAPEHLREYLARAPLDDSARMKLDAELVAGHCGRLPESMVVGMRAAQTVRDAAMTAAMLRARGGGPVWLIAGNGHVRKDIAVPRLLRVAAPGSTVLAVGLLERADGVSQPPTEMLARYDVVIVTPRQNRPDPCAQ